MLINNRADFFIEEKKSGEGFVSRYNAHDKIMALPSPIGKVSIHMALSRS